MHRDRPLQNSMILPQTNNNSNKRLSAPMEYNFPIPNVKKITNYMSQPNFQPLHNHSLIIHQSQQRQQFQRSVTVQQDNNHNSRTNDSMLHELYQKIEKLTKTVQKHEVALNTLTIQGQFSKRVMNEVKKNLPVFTGGNDVYEHILNLKLDIKNIQQQLTKTPKLTDLQSTIKKQVQAIQKKPQSTTSTNPSSSKQSQLDPMLKQLLCNRDQHFQNILANLQTQISIIKKSISNLHIQMKVSPIVSNSCIILKYQQLFKSKNKIDNDMILNEYTYYIDNEGYLLDFHSRYIVDQKGKKIKLEQKHITMLKNQKILN